MKLALALFVFFSIIYAGPASADLGYELDCRVAKLIDDNVFEEGLSPGEYPDVYIQKDRSGRLVEATVGMTGSYWVKDGDRIEKLAPSAGRSRYVLHRAEPGRLIVLITVSQTSGPRPGYVWGNLSVKQSARAVKEVALLVCRK